MSELEMNNDSLLNYLNETLIFNIQSNTETNILNLEQFLKENKIFHLNLVKDLIIKKYRELSRNYSLINIDRKLSLFVSKIKENIGQYKEYYNKKLIKEVLKYVSQKEIISHIFNSTIELNNNNNNFVQINDLNLFLDQNGFIFKKHIIEYIYNLCLEYICDNNLEFYVFVPEKIQNKIKIKLKSSARIERRNVRGTKRNILQLINNFIIDLISNETKLKDLKQFYLTKLPIEIHKFLNKNREHRNGFYNLILDVKFYFTDKKSGKETQIYTSLKEQFEVYGIIGDADGMFIDIFFDKYVKMIINTLDEDDVVDLKFIENCFIISDYIKKILNKSKLDYKFMKKLLKELRSIVRGQTITMGRKVVYPQSLKNMTRQNKYKTRVHVSNLGTPKEKSPYTQQPRKATKRKTSLRQVTTVKSEIPLSKFKELDLNKYVDDQHKISRPYFLIDEIKRRQLLKNSHYARVLDIIYIKLEKIIRQLNGKTNSEKIDNFFKIFLGLKGANNNNSRNYRALNNYLYNLVRTIEILRLHKKQNKGLKNKEVYEHELLDFNIHENFILKKKLSSKKPYTTKYYNNNLTQNYNGILPENEINNLTGYNKKSNQQKNHTMRRTAQRIRHNNPRQ